MRSAAKFMPRTARVRPGEWVDDAACLDEDPELFFPGRGNASSLPDAYAVCAGCPVRVQCGEMADANGERYGVWAGVLRGV